MLSQVAALQGPYRPGRNNLSQIRSRQPEPSPFLLNRHHVKQVISMRLLDTSTIKPVKLPNPPAEYAILSHIWQNGEVLYRDLTTDVQRELPGWENIMRCCELAAKDGWQYIWTDTHCMWESHPY